MSHNHSFKHLSFPSIPVRLALALGLLIVALGTTFVILILAQPGNPALDPPRNSHTAPLTTTVSITYDEPMDPTTVTSQTFAIHGMQSGLVTETHSVVNNNTIIVTPTHAFFPGELVYAVATTQTANITGTHPLTPTLWQFNAGEVTNRCVEGFSDISAGLTGVNSGGVAWGDYDNDGDLDILLAGENSSGAAVTEVWRNEDCLLDLSIVKTVTPSTAAPGETITYTLTFSNAGGVAATGVVITDSVPVSVTSPTVVGSGGAAITLTGSAPHFVWSVANLAPGQGGVITLTGVLSEPLAAGVFTNTAEIACAETEGDETNNSSDAPLTVQNVAPVAAAGSDQTVLISTTVILDGSASSDANGDALTYGWAQTGRPSVTLSDASAISPTFTAPGAAGVLTFTLAVTDSHGLADPTPDEVVVTVTSNLHPIADAGNDQSVTTGATVTLDGSASSDPDGHTPLTYSWTQSGGTMVSFNATLSRTTFTAPPAADVLTFTLTVTDSHGLADDTPDEVVITVSEVITHYAYLPLLARNYIAAPDLVVQSVTATGDSVQVVIENQGSTPVTDEFWVDVYVNPSPAPTGVNQLWPDLADEGLVWGVKAAALPLAPGDVLTLTVGDAYYVPEHSQVAWPLAEGTPVYAQVDSWNAVTTYGAVLENHEITGGVYNNISSTVSTAGLAGEPW